LLKYVALEAPGWVLAGGVLAYFEWRGDLSRLLALLLFALWVLKDFALYPLLRSAYEDGRPDGAGNLLGALGTVREPLDPEGYVRVGSELWRAVVTRDQAPVEAGAPVRVLEVRDLTLRVERA
jgi:membrane-bound serine protease (ClpP class)